MTEWAPAGWHPDPQGRYEYRYWDGIQWTNHVASRGYQHINSLVGGPPVPTVNPASKKVQRQVRRIGVTEGVQVGDEALFTEPILVVNQKSKLFEINAEYAVYDQRGQQIGAVREVGQSVMKKAIAATNRTRRLQVVDMNGRVLLALTQPTKVLNAKMIVMGANGTQVGQIKQKFTFNHVRFRLESGGQALGSIQGESQQELDFSIKDANENEIGRITRTRVGLAKELFTKADNYVVEIHRPLDEPLRSLVIGAALAVDTALRQK